MDENKVIRPMDFVRLTNIDELNVIKDTKNHIGLVKEVSRAGSYPLSCPLDWREGRKLDLIKKMNT